jgi:hypothetical protein
VTLPLTCERYAALFAEAGMITLSFTQAAWFGSGPQLPMEAKPPVSGGQADASPQVHRVRDLVDPIDWLHNRRTDAWGVSLENRARFLLDAIKATRAAVGADFPVAVKHYQQIARLGDGLKPAQRRGVFSAFVRYLWDEYVTAWRMHQATNAPSFGFRGLLCRCYP